MKRRPSEISALPRSGVTRYLQLYTRLVQSLAKGVYRKGRSLPSEPDLVQRYRVSRTTVRSALARLEKEGLIMRKRGSGTFACGNPRQLAARSSLPLLRSAYPGNPSRLGLNSPRKAARRLIRR